VVPATSAGATPFVAGNLLSPTWRPDGVALEPVANGRFRVTLQLPAGSTLEYKFTLGGWESVEKNTAGTAISTRRRRIDGGMTIVDTVQRWGTGSPGARLASTIAGTVRLHPGFRSAHLAAARDVSVYLPSGYAATDARYPVLYMHDGQNLFDRASAFGGREWEMDETAERLIREGSIRPLIIVGVHNTGARMSEYTPPGASPTPGRGGDDYLRFVVEELKPFIDSSYRTLRGRDDTAIAGSSLGGLISLAAALWHPDVFGMAGVMSPSLFWNGAQMLTESARDESRAALGRVRFWLDIGTAEQRPAPGDSLGTAQRNTRRLVEIFRNAGLRADSNYRYLEVEGGEHNETWWARRAGQMLVFFFPAAR
jgi:predicted alpha/beta superfamily hydrolase